MIIVGGCCSSNLSVEFLLWIVYVPRYSVDYFRAVEPSQKWRSSGSGALLFMNKAPAPELLVFMSVAPVPELFFFMTLVPAPASIRFHTLTL